LSQRIPALHDTFDPRTLTIMLLIAVALLAVPLVAGLIAAYVAYPDRGEDIPHATWLSDAMVKARDKMSV